MRASTQTGRGAAAVVLTALFVGPMHTAEADINAYYDCTPAQVGTFNATMPSRVHVLCTIGYVYGQNTIYYFAVSGSDQAGAARALSLFTTAKVTGKNLRIYFDPANTSGAAWGCGSNDCRIAAGVEVLP